MLFWLRPVFYWVYFETVVELREPEPSRALSSQHYCLRAAQDSQGVALPPLWLHNSHALNGAPTFSFKLGFMLVHRANFMGVNLPLSLFCSQTESSKYQGPDCLPLKLSEHYPHPHGQRMRDWVGGSETGRELFISHRRTCERNKNGRVETDGERTQKRQNCNYLP